MRLFFLISLLYIDDLCSAMNPYHVLGVSRSATIPQIKRSYKNLAKKYHPDKNQNIDANDKFIELNKAYEVFFKFIKNCRKLKFFRADFDGS